MGCCDSNEEHHGINMARGGKGVGSAFNEEGVELSSDMIASINSKWAHCLEEIGTDLWDDPEGLDDAENSDNEDLDSSNVTLSRKGVTHDLMKSVSVITL